MAKYWTLFLFIAWFGLLLISSVLLFTNGFLLTRVTQEKNSTYSLVKLDPRNFTDFLATISKRPGQLPRKSQVILIVIDALRHDFTEYVESLDNPLPYQNKLPIIRDLLVKNPQNSNLFKFIADPPTTTMQRLKGITTGSLPTFIDAGSNFASNEINEDNIIDQLYKNGHNIVCMGDDTWGSLYPNRFIRNYFYPSFNVWDLDTVDNGVLTNLYREINRPDWSLIIAHFLGVDHCGHRYGPDHPEMTRKLTEMNNVISKVKEEMNDETILFVIGDHGMTNSGDHGGESDNEIKSAMFVYSKQSLSNKHFIKHNNTIKQVDLVPTLATILGVPIPFSNLGSVVFDVIPTLSKSKTYPYWYSQLHAVWSNLLQVTNYITEYSSNTNSFSKETLEKITEQFEVLESELLLVDDETKFQYFAIQSLKLIGEIRMACEEIWVEFDAFSMSRGLLLTSFISILLYFLIEGQTIDNLHELIDKTFVKFAYLIVLLAGVTAGVLYLVNLIESLLNTVFFAMGLAAIVYLSYFLIQGFDDIASNLYQASKKRKWLDISARFILLLTFLMLFTNSYIVEEAKVTLFMFITLLLLIVFDLRQVGKLKRSAKHKIYGTVAVICILMRASTYFWGCRDENNCLSTLSKWGSSTKLELCLALVALSLFVTITRIWLRSCGNLTGFALNNLLARYQPTVIVVACGGFWVLNHVPKDKLMFSWQREAFAWVVFTSASIALGALFRSPLLLHVVTRKHKTSADDSDAVPQLFQQMKDLFGSKKDSSSIPIVYGLATVYSAGFVAAIIYVVLVWCLLLGDVVAPGGIVVMIVGGLTLGIVAISRYEKATSVEKLLIVPFPHIILWYILSIYSFYGSRHQPTFTNIAWEAAFVGTSGTFITNLIPATLVIFNTFGSHILFAFALPLLVVAPFTVYAMFPTLAGKKVQEKKSGDNKEVILSRGDFKLLDHEQTLFNGVLDVGCRYIICHVLRVFGSMLSATIHCRHLMVWAIFAPKLIFEAIGMFFIIAAVLLGYLLLIRLNTKLNKFVADIEKGR